MKTTKPKQWLKDKAKSSPFQDLNLAKNNKLLCAKIKPHL